MKNRKQQYLKGNLVHPAYAMLLGPAALTIAGCSNGGEATMGTVTVDAAALASQATGEPTASSTTIPIANATAARSDVIRPSGYTQMQLDRTVSAFYQSWRIRYVRQGCGNGRYYVDVAPSGENVGGGTAAGSLTVSEAHGYGMLITALMADTDINARKTFDGMVRYFRDHPAASSPYLMAWNQLRDCSNAMVVGGDRSATDGDLDIAYALVLADRKWGSTGSVNYRQLALNVLNAILDEEIDRDKKFVRIGDWAENADDSAYAETTRSSDFMVSHFASFSKFSGDDRWTAVRNRTYSIIDTVRKGYSPNTGLMPDFIIDTATNPRPAPANFLEGPNDGSYSWNAARYPWRLALDYLINGDKRALAAVRPINAWIQRATNGDPMRISATYRLNGKYVANSGENELAFNSMLAVAATLDPNSQKWLDALWRNVAERKINDDVYYGNTLKLLAMITIAGKFK